MKRTKEDAEETKNKIFTAALHIFSKKGFSESTLMDIATEAGVTRGAVYWHFKNKEELYWKLNEKYNYMFFGKINDLFKLEIKGSEKLKTIVTYIFDLLEDNEEFRMLEEINSTKLVINEAMMPFCNYMHKLAQDKLNVIHELIKKGVEEGEFREDLDTRSIATSILCYVYGLETFWLQERSFFSIKKESPAFIDIILKGISK